MDKPYNVSIQSIDPAIPDADNQLLAVNEALEKLAARRPGLPRQQFFIDYPSRSWYKRYSSFTAGRASYQAL